MNRRGFLAALASALVLDPEHLLWRPGEKLISIPEPRGVVMPCANILGQQIDYIRPNLEMLTIISSVLYKKIKVDTRNLRRAAW